MLFFSPRRAQATSPEQARILAWSPATWLQAYALPGHALSVTQLAFSHDDAFLLSGSRDRAWCLYRRVGSGSAEAGAAAAAQAPRYELAHCEAKAHERIVWGVAWAHDDAFFATASRDKSVKVWARPAAADSAGAWRLHSTLAKLPDSATAVAWAPRCALFLAELSCPALTYPGTKGLRGLARICWPSGWKTASCCSRRRS